MTKTLIVVSSITGNTFKVGQALAQAYPNAKLVRTQQAKDDATLIESFDTVIVGFWCDKGGLPPDLVSILPQIVGKKLGIFSTMTGDPTTEKALKWFSAQCNKIVGEGQGNTLKATFLCQGKLSPALMSQFMKNPQLCTPERQAKWEKASTHPDEIDCRNAVLAFAPLF